MTHYECVCHHPASIGVDFGQDVLINVGGAVRAVPISTILADPETLFYNEYYRLVRARAPAKKDKNAPSVPVPSILEFDETGPVSSVSTSNAHVSPKSESGAVTRSDAATSKSNATAIPGHSCTRCMVLSFVHQAHGIGDYVLECLASGTVEDFVDLGEAKRNRILRALAYFKVGDVRASRILNEVGTMGNDARGLIEWFVRAFSLPRELRLARGHPLLQSFLVQEFREARLGRGTADLVSVFFRNAERMITKGPARETTDWVAEALMPNVAACDCIRRRMIRYGLIAETDARFQLDAEAVKAASGYRNKNPEQRGQANALEMMRMSDRSKASAKGTAHGTATTSAAPYGGSGPGSNGGATQGNSEYEPITIHGPSPLEIEEKTPDGYGSLFGFWPQGRSSGSAVQDPEDNPLTRTVQDDTLDSPEVSINDALAVRNQEEDAEVARQVEQYKNSMTQFEVAGFHRALLAIVEDRAKVYTEWTQHIVPLSALLTSESPSIRRSATSELCRRFEAVHLVQCHVEDKTLLCHGAGARPTGKDHLSSYPFPVLVNHHNDKCKSRNLVAVEFTVCPIDATRRLRFGAVSSGTRSLLALR